MTKAFYVKPFEELNLNSSFRPYHKENATFMSCSAVLEKLTKYKDPQTAWKNWDNGIHMVDFMSYHEVKTPAKWELAIADILEPTVPLFQNMGTKFQNVDLVDAISVMRAKPNNTDQLAYQFSVLEGQCMNVLIEKQNAPFAVLNPLRVTHYIAYAFQYALMSITRPTVDVYAYCALTNAASALELAQYTSDEFDYSVRYKINKQQANIIRTYFPNPKFIIK